MSKIGLNRVINRKKISIGLAILIATTLMSGIANSAQAYDYQSDGSAKIHSWPVDGGSRIDIWNNTVSNYNPQMVTGKMVSGDFDGDNQTEIGLFYDYTNNNTELHILDPNELGNMSFRSSWESNSFNANRITSKVTSGDFDGDGKDEIAALYDYGNSETGLFIFKAQSGSVNKFNCIKTWESPSFTGGCIKGITAGDFNGNGKDEIVALYDYGNNNTAVFEFTRENDQSYSVEKTWESSTFNGSCVGDRFVSGDYNGDGKDEIAMFYNYGGNNSAIFSLNKGNNGMFNVEKTWESSTFNVDRITSKVASTKLGNKQKDKIIAFYDYRNNTTGMFEFSINSGSNFDCKTKPELGSYEASRIDGKVLAGKFNGKTWRIAAFYNGEKQDKGKEIVEYAKQFQGIPYVWGGTTPSGFDCSGFTQYVFRNKAGIDITRTTYTQINQGTYVSRDNLRPGDLVFFGNGSPDHVGIYIGNNQYIHSPESGDVVKISPLTRRDYMTARRIV
ncbi:NlpC/P60 family protein [Clostridium ihumii]|uniref:NlpC/P60 family protein n=1 Tax=Clostridium ihumii TaxID=1470356 RepID=UPI000684E7A1|nr:NlpC/P60 family protein [Clostridium ihumii]